VTPRESGVTLQSWLWAPPAKHSTRQIEEPLERIGTLYELGIHRHFADVPDDLLRRYARRLANRPPSIGATDLAAGPGRKRSGRRGRCAGIE
jgi:hypothetical protein